MAIEQLARTCKNCDSKLDKSYSYCPQCSQRVEDEQDSLKGLLNHFLTDYFTFDSKITKSVWPLLSSPGTLTEEFVKGRRVRYIPPLRMYVFVSLVFFLILGWNNGSEATTALESTVADDHFFSTLLSRLFFVLLPVFALLLAMLFRSKKVSLVYHLVFSLHYHAFVFLAMLVYLLLSKIASWLSVSGINIWLFGLFSIGFIFYLYLALRKVYAFSHKATALRFLALLLLYGIVLVVSSLVALGVETLMLG